MKQYTERGLTGIKVIGPGDVMDDDLLNDMGDAALGAVTAHMYSAAHPSEKNKKFVADYQKAFGNRPGFMAAGGWDGIDMIYQALKKTNGNADGDALIAAMKGMKWESPRGPISIDPGYPRHRPEHLPPQGGEEGRRSSGMSNSRPLRPSRIRARRRRRSD